MHGLETIKAMNSRGQHEAVLPFLRPHAIDNSARVVVTQALSQLDRYRLNLEEVLTGREMVVMKGPLTGKTGVVTDVAFASSGSGSASVYVMLRPASFAGPDPDLWADVFAYPDQLQLLSEV